MKTLHTLIAVIAVQCAVAQNIVFTDSNLKQKLIADSVDTGNDGEISLEEALAVDSLYLDSSGITSLNDLTHFINLDFIDASHNQITELPSSGLSLLMYLNLSVNKLTELNASGYTNLRELYVHRNDSLKQITVSGLAKLEKFGFSATAVKNMDVSGCVNLTKMQSGGSLDTLRSNFGYIVDYETFKQFSSVDYLDLSNHPTLTKFSGLWEGFTIGYLNLDNCKALDTIIVSNGVVKELSIVNDSNLVEVVLDNYDGASTLVQILKQNPKLVKLTMGQWAPYTLFGDTIVVDGHQTLEELRLYKVNGLTLKNCPKLHTFGGSSGTIKIDGCPELKTLELHDVEELNINNCESFSAFPESWDAFGYTIKRVSVTNCPALTTLRTVWYESKIESLTLTGCINLTSLYLGGMNLDTLDLTTNTKLTHLECQLNPIRNLEVSHLPELTYLNCNTTAMKQLSLCFDHKISHLNVNGHDSLFHVLVKDTSTVLIDEILASSDSSSMFIPCLEVVVSVGDVTQEDEKKIVRAFNLLGVEVPIRTRNTVIIVEYSDGTFEKVFRKK
ncbi:MAG: hypothetical protein ACJAZ2_001248 [Glaciecola sp.]|jgi:hypothetical protein